MTRRISIRFCIGEGAETITAEGRVAWALLQLIVADERGCTPIDNPAPRWSAYVFKLRRLGVSVETIHEPHGGPFSGTHARYVLRSTINVLEPAHG
ncbi:winged helix domain-containing protein [Acuticoccus yangtzensis]|uniref:winged helix domain-containing protein n=1 Tax=Acuticoccus yangtzensis TaxID=1443441 RepID=UPI00094964CF